MKLNSIIRQFTQQTADLNYKKIETVSLKWELRIIQ